jgi:hypothetical protein
MTGHDEHMADDKSKVNHQKSTEDTAPHKNYDSVNTHNGEKSRGAKSEEDPLPYKVDGGPCADTGEERLRTKCGDDSMGSAKINGCKDGGQQEEESEEEKAPHKDKDQK